MKRLVYSFYIIMFLLFPQTAQNDPQHIDSFRKDTSRIWSKYGRKLFEIERQSEEELNNIMEKYYESDAGGNIGNELYNDPILYLERAIKADSENYEGWFYLGSCYLRKGYLGEGYYSRNFVNEPKKALTRAKNVAKGKPQKSESERVLAEIEELLIKYSDGLK